MPIISCCIVNINGGTLCVDNKTLEDAMDITPKMYHRSTATGIDIDTLLLVAVFIFGWDELVALVALLLLLLFAEA